MFSAKEPQGATNAEDEHVEVEEKSVELSDKLRDKVDGASVDDYIGDLEVKVKRVNLSDKLKDNIDEPSVDDHASWQGAYERRINDRKRFRVIALSILWATRLLRNCKRRRSLGKTKWHGASRDYYPLWHGAYGNPSWQEAYVDDNPFLNPASLNFFSHQPLISGRQSFRVIALSILWATRLLRSCKRRRSLGKTKGHGASGDCYPLWHGTYGNPSWREAYVDDNLFLNPASLNFLWHQPLISGRQRFRVIALSILWAKRLLRSCRRRRSLGKTKWHRVFGDDYPLWHDASVDYYPSLDQAYVDYFPFWHQPQTSGQQRFRVIALSILWAKRLLRSCRRRRSLGKTKWLGVSGDDYHLLRGPYDNLSRKIAYLNDNLLLNPASLNFSWHQPLGLKRFRAIVFSILWAKRLLRSCKRRRSLGKTKWLGVSEDDYPLWHGAYDNPSWQGACVDDNLLSNPASLNFSWHQPLGLQRFCAIALSILWAKRLLRSCRRRRSLGETKWLGVFGDDYHLRHVTFYAIALSILWANRLLRSCRRRRSLGKTKWLGVFEDDYHLRHEAYVDDYPLLHVASGDEHILVEQDSRLPSIVKQESELPGFWEERVLGQGSDTLLYEPGKMGSKPISKRKYEYDHSSDNEATSKKVKMMDDASSDHASSEEMSFNVVQWSYASSLQGTIELLYSPEYTYKMGSDDEIIPDCLSDKEFEIADMEKYLDNDEFLPDNLSDDVEEFVKANMEEHSDDDSVSEKEDLVKEYQIFLRSEGRSYRARADKMNMFWKMYWNKSWHMQLTSAKMTDYQRLAIYPSEEHPYYYKYAHLFYTYEFDFAYQKFIDDLYEKIKWDTSTSDAQSTAEKIWKKHLPDDEVQLGLLFESISTAIYLSKVRQTEKELGPLFLNLCKRKEDEDNFKEALTEKGLECYPLNKVLIENALKEKHLLKSQLWFRYLDMKRFCNIQNKEASLKENRLKDLITDYFLISVSSSGCEYIDYVKEKIIFAKKLKIL